VACWSTKAAISLKRVKIEEKLLWRPYRNSPVLFSNGKIRIPDPTAASSPRLGFATPPKIAVAIISGTGKATEYRLQIWPVHSQGPSEQKPIKNFGGRSVGISRDCPIFRVYAYLSPIISGTGKPSNFKFCTRIRRINRDKSPLKISGKVAVGVLRDSQQVSGHPYIGRIGSSLR